MKKGPLTVLLWLLWLVPPLLAEFRAPLEVRIEMNPAAVNRLRRAPRDWVKASVWIDGKSFAAIPVRLKGKGSFQSIDQKPGFTLDLTNAANRFEDFERAHLNNCVEDPSYLRDWLGHEVCRQAGLPMPRVLHARVALNGRNLGLYEWKEGMDAAFWTRAGGIPAPASRGEKIAFRSQKESEESWERLNADCDLPEILELMALEVLLCQWDGYSLANNNFTTYKRTVSGKLAILPSGMDQLFGNPRLTWRPSMNGPLARAILRDPKGAQAYRETFWQLFADVLNPAALIGRLREAETVLTPSLPLGKVSHFHAALDELCGAIRQREASLQQERAGLQGPSFQNELLLGARWNIVDPPEKGAMSEAAGPDGSPCLSIRAGPRTSASWRARANLQRGKYSFEGRAWLEGFKPLPFGQRQGGSLRVAGRPGESCLLTNTRGWDKLAIQFEVTAPAEDVEFLCELRASHGIVWFKRDSLKIKRLQ